MPYRVVKRKGSRPYKIIKTTTGKVVGSSKSRASAESSVRARNAASYGTKKNRRIENRKRRRGN